MCYSCSLPPQMPFSPCRIALSTWGVRTHASEPLDRYPTTYNSSSPGGGPQNPCFTLPCSHQFCPPFIWVKKGLCSAFNMHWYKLVKVEKGALDHSLSALMIQGPCSLQSAFFYLFDSIVLFLLCCHYLCTWLAGGKVPQVSYLSVLCSGQQNAWNKVNVPHWNDFMRHLALSSFLSI